LHRAFDLQQQGPLPHHALHPLVVDVDAVPLQCLRDPPIPIAGEAQDERFDPGHQLVIARIGGRAVAA
jgi:hypothetical protein